MAEELNFPLLWATVPSGERVIWTWCDHVWIQHRPHNLVILTPPSLNHVLFKGLGGVLYIFLIVNMHSVVLFILVGETAR